jgi:hydrogenase maturation protein HypF
VASFEGQAAMELEYRLVGAKEDGSYPFAVREAHGAWVLDWEPAVRALLASPDRADAAALFHNTLVEMALDVAGQLGEKHVALSGGCFQNRYLTERMVSRLRDAGYRTYWHQRVPPNDGGLALGQIMAAKTQQTGERID